MKQSITHIIWDFNGTLLCDAQLSVDTDNAVFDRLGLPRITLEDYRHHMTMPVRDFYLALGVDYSVHPYELISRLWLDSFNAHAVDAGLVPGVLAVVEALARTGCTQSVLSASYEVNEHFSIGAKINYTWTPSHTLRHARYMSWGEDNAHMLVWGGVFATLSF